MKTFEFQFRWGGKRQCFGVDVNAASIAEAVEKANRFFDSDEAVHPLNHPDVERLWINVAAPVTARNVASIYGPQEDPECRDFTVVQWRREYEVKCSLCRLPCLVESAHLDQGKWICAERCCEDRPKVSE
jgi:hypothetical protein